MHRHAIRRSAREPLQSPSGTDLRTGGPGQDTVQARVGWREEQAVHPQEPSEARRSSCSAMPRYALRPADQFHQKGGSNALGRKKRIPDRKLDVHEGIRSTPRW